MLASSPGHQHGGRKAAFTIAVVFAELQRQLAQGRSTTPAMSPCRRYLQRTGVMADDAGWRKLATPPTVHNGL
jgi:hypothetical protein